MSALSQLREHILVVDDEAAIRDALRITLAGFGFEITPAANGEDALMLIRRHRFDAVLLDLNMPGMGGMAACREIRKLDMRLPVLMLTVRDRPEDKVEALEGGADDYVTKPFHVGELSARLRAALRRTNMASAPADHRIRIGDISLDPDRRTVHKGSYAVRLTPREFDLLRYLMVNAGRAIAHGRLLAAVWGPEYGDELEYLRTFIHQLRKKLEDDPARPTYLLTEAWYGYRFREA
jgi:two-component system, OmpR family, KDP operon response regulator KdpE